VVPPLHERWNDPSRDGRLPPVILAAMGGNAQRIRTCRINFSAAPVVVEDCVPRLKKPGSTAPPLRA